MLSTQVLNRFLVPVQCAVIKRVAILYGNAKTTDVTEIHILYIGRNILITETIVRLINRIDGWKGVGINDDDEAMALFTSLSFEIILLGCGINEKEEIVLRSFFKAHNPEVRIIQHYGGGSGLLYNEITAALANRNEITNFL